MNKFNKEYFKQKISWYRQLFTLFFAVVVGCIAWLAANLEKPGQILVNLDILAIFVALVVLGILNTKVRDYIKKLRD